MDITQGILPHRYINASDDPEAWAADQCGRQGVTVEWFFRQMDPDTPAWVYDSHANECGLDPWREIEGIDPFVDGERFDLWMITGKGHEVQKDFRIFVQVKAIPEEARSQLVTGEEYRRKVFADLHARVEEKLAQRDDPSPS